MTNRERWQEQYNDAQFALMMDDFARREGERLIEENEALKKDPSAAVPEEVTRRCLQTIRRALFRRRYRFTASGAGRVLGRLAIAAVLILALFTTAFAASPAFRAGALNLLVQIDEQFAAWQLAAGETIPALRSPGASPLDGLNEDFTWLPEGYTQTDAFSDEHRTTVTFANPSGETIEITILPGNLTTYYIDTEDPDYYENTTVHDAPAILVEKAGLSRIVWADTNLGLSVYIDATALSTEELTAFAEGVTLH